WSDCACTWLGYRPVTASEPRAERGRQRKWSAASGCLRRSPRRSTSATSGYRWHGWHRHRGGHGWPRAVTVRGVHEEGWVTDGRVAQPEGEARGGRGTARQAGQGDRRDRRERDSERGSHGRMVTLALACPSSVPRDATLWA